MTLRSEIRAVLAAGPRNAAQLHELCESSKSQAAMSANLSMLKGIGKIKAIGTIDGLVSYGLANWPEKAARDKTAPPPKAARRKKGAKASRTRPAELIPAPIATNGAAKFAVLDDGTLTLIKGDIRVDLDQAEFARLRKFTERTESAWNPTEE